MFGTPHYPCGCDWSGECDEHSGKNDAKRELLRAEERGFNKAIKTYWQNVCLQKALEADGRAADLQLAAWGSRSRAGVTDKDGVLRMHESYFNAGPPGSSTRRHWMVSGLRLLDDIEDAYQKARDAAEVGRQLRKWAAE